MLLLALHTCDEVIIEFVDKGNGLFSSRLIATDRVCHVWCNFEPGYTCRTIVVFGTLKDCSLQV